ncbi:hypothetical protein Afil01_16380 [Actinorhabdospora filicis]|uniref:Lactococcin 972 family bacteriocin n=1 Tax=Actinorhabdospora filicis TaxID=1785913 RepID=A0A9W6SJL4_9ACTN|nr:hypothetical protein [Actinorhabdospora filicis]GLZ76831.1 hypothetical protein Afil01_16380 [Actinorhabdospora filicis]
MRKPFNFRRGMWGLKALAVAGIAVMGMVVAAPVVSANPGDYTADGARIWHNPGWGGPDGLGYRGDGANVYCYVGEWNYHTNLKTGVTGYSHDSVITWTGGIGPC